jgi:putative membrane protein
MLGKFSKYQVATAIAVFFHAIGFFGIVFFKKPFFVQSTPANLLLVLVLMLWTQPAKTSGYFLFAGTCFITGMLVEITGVHTALFFGNYAYGKVLGYKIMDTPVIIGVNWFVVVFCSGTAVYFLQAKLFPAKQGVATKSKSTKVLLPALVAALLTVFFDWLMEPVAIRLHYWQWVPAGMIPLYNYVCWFIVSFLLLLIFYRGNFDKQNRFAINLLLLQWLFFILLRLFLH